MDPHSEDVERWLASEARADEQGAESAFAHLLAAVPRIEPQPGFIERTRAAAWRSRLRRQMMARVARAAALLLVATGGVSASWLALLYAGPWLLMSGAGMASGSLGGIVTGAVTGLEWWARGARVAVVIGETLARREAAGVLLAVEVVGALALYALHQLVRSATANSTSWEVEA